jgi:hypothetical protein
MKSIIRTTVLLAIITLACNQTQAQAIVRPNCEPTLVDLTNSLDVQNQVLAVTVDAISYFPNFEYSITMDEKGAPQSIRVKGVNDKIAKSFLEAQLLDLEMIQFEMSSSTYKTDKLIVRRD